MRILIRIIAISIFLFLLGNSAFAAEIPVRAIITKLEGSVMIQAQGKAIAVPAILGTELKVGDRIITGTNGTLEIRFSDDSISRVSPNARVEVERLHIDTSDNSSITVLKSTMGKIWNKVQELTNKNSRFEVNTPAAVAGVRGTAFLVDVQNLMNSTIRVYEGTVGVVSSESPTDTSVQEILVNSNEQARVETGSAPAKGSEELDVMLVDEWEKDNLAEDLPIVYILVETEVKNIQLAKADEKIQQNQLELELLVKEIELLRQLQQENLDETKLAELKLLEEQLHQEIELIRGII
ncbi:MAG: FecR family protein, partial [Bacillota bacterium]|nr:FecR family protein [Bacillota bacterium]